MNDTPSLPADPAPSARPAAPHAAAATPAFNVPWQAILRWFFVFCVVGILAGLFLPAFNTTCAIGSQTKSFAQAKQIGLALKLYAGDHDGAYPAGTNPKTGEPIRTANDAFRALFPTYLTSESIFGNPLSAYQSPAPPDNNAAPGHILQPGENVYGYVAGLTEANPPAAPLVVDGTDGTGRGTYSTDPKARGGTWKGTKVIVIHLDNMGSLENLKNSPPAPHLESSLGDGTTGNPLSPAGLATFRLKDGPPVQLLDPAYPPAKTGSTH